MPGFVTADYPGYLFPPHPAHHYQNRRLTEILQDRMPLATGPFVVETWEPGVGLRLLPNPWYSGEAPRLEEIVVLFPQYDVRHWPELLRAGECDVVLPTSAMGVDRQSWMQLALQGEAVVWAGVGAQPRVLRLDLNLAPRETGPAPLADARVREAIAHCVDRSRLVQVLPNEALIAAISFLPPGHPALLEAELESRGYDPERGMALLEEAGWRDEDGDGIREASEAAPLLLGEPLSLTLVLAPQYTVSAAHVAADLEYCGIGVQPQTVEAQDLYRAQPESPLFGRTFDLALFGWWAEVPEVCGAWRSDRIPRQESNWIGENFSGYEAEAYDAACNAALRALNPEAQFAALAEAASLLYADLPTLLLTWRPYWFVTRPDVQGLRPDASHPAAIPNIGEVYRAP